LGVLAEELTNKTYSPQAVPRVWIPKPDGKHPPPGIPKIRDRVVQAAAVLVLEPIFEADLPDAQHAYRRIAARHMGRLVRSDWVARGSRRWPARRRPAESA
jgi:hypothetical protein